MDDGRPMERKLAAILSADVEGYSRLMSADETATVRAITAYREVIASAVSRHGGRVVDAPGDNVLAEFASVVDAVESAVEIQRTLHGRNADLPCRCCTCDRIRPSSGRSSGGVGARCRCQDDPDTGRLGAEN